MSKKKYHVMIADGTYIFTREPEGDKELKKLLELLKEHNCYFQVYDEQENLIEEN